MNTPATIAEKIERLPPELRNRLGAFVDELLTIVPEEGADRKRPRLGWAGGLSEVGETCTSVELLHGARKREEVRQGDDSRSLRRP